ncbi:MAG TPA: hypothetical protein V6D18_18805 [Thermosynechococcaceae cyanobacterium]
MIPEIPGRGGEGSIQIYQVKKFPSLKRNDRPMDLSYESQRSIHEQVKNFKLYLSSQAKYR